MSTTTRRRNAARRAALGTTAAIAGMLTAGVSTAFLALLLSDQGCSAQDGTPSAEAQRAIPPVMLAAYQAASVQYHLPWEVLAGIGKEECDNGRDADPSCAIQPGAQGPGVANSAAPRDRCKSAWAASREMSTRRCANTSLPASRTSARTIPHSQSNSPRWCSSTTRELPPASQSTATCHTSGRTTARAQPLTLREPRDRRRAPVRGRRHAGRRRRRMRRGARHVREPVLPDDQPRRRADRHGRRLFGLGADPRAG